MEQPKTNYEARGGALITGASRGVGAAIALQLAAEKFTVGLVGRDESRLAAIAEACRALGSEARVYLIDITDEHQLRRLAEQASRELGGITVLVHNAGIFREAPFHRAAIEDWNETIDCNIRPLFTLTKLLLPDLERASRAAIITIGSVASRRAYQGGSMYAASKHAALGFSNSLFLDLRELGIRVSTILPGYANTDMHVGAEKLDPAKMIQPEDIARAVSFILNFPEGSCPTEITVLPQRDPRIT